MNRILLTILFAIITLTSYAEEPVKFSENNKWGLKDKSGKIILPPTFDYIEYFINGLCMIEQNKKYGFIDATGKCIIEPTFDSLDYFYEDVAAALQNERWGFIDKTGNYVIEPKFIGVGYFENGTAPAKLLNGKNGFIDKYGNFYKSKKVANAALKKLEALHAMRFQEFLVAFNEFAHNKLLTESELVAAVETEVKAWQQKGEFESTADWQKRVNEETRAAKVNEIVERLTAQNNRILAIAAKDYCDYRAKKFASQTMELKPYDADNQCYLISTANYGDILLPVPLANAPAFKQDWESIKSTASASFVVSGNDVALQSVKFGEYVYDANTNANYAQVDIDYNFKPIDIQSINSRLGDLASNTPSQKQATVAPRNIEPERKNLAASDGEDISNVDRIIPQGSEKRQNTFALIIANENYNRVSPVAYAGNDGKILSQYVEKTLGVPQKNIFTLTDCSLNDMRYHLKRISEICNAYSGDASLIVYYAGHGVPDESTSDAYLLPVDGYASDVTTGISLKEIMNTLNDLPAKQVTVFLDACFTGTGRDNQPLYAARGVAIKPKSVPVGGNVVMFSAAQGTESAAPYHQMKHGLFTYFLLNKLHENKGKVTLGELSDYVIENVKRTSVVEGKMQTPTVQASENITNWQNLKL